MIEMTLCEKCCHEEACNAWRGYCEIPMTMFVYNMEACPFFRDRSNGKYIKLEDLQKFPIRRDHCDREYGNEHFVNGIETVMEYAEYLPTYDIGGKP